MMTFIEPRVARLLLLIYCLCGCSESGVDAQLLASDFHFKISGHHIVIPAVAIARPGHTFDLNRSRPKKSLKQQLQAIASDSNHPLQSDQLDVAIEQYQYFGERMDSVKICPLLTRNWSRTLCTGGHGGLLRRLPERFRLLDRSKMDLLRNNWTVGRESEYDQVKDMKLQPSVTEIGCDQESKFCTAVVEVQPGLLAVWTVWSDDRTGVTALTMANEQGSAIVRFVRRALGRVEDTTLVDED